MKTLQEALDFLAEQPDIAAYLKSRELLVQPENGSRAYTCPVARYLNAEVGGLCWAAIAVAGMGQAGGEGESLPLPSAVAEFIAAFDNGEL